MPTAQIDYTANAREDAPGVLYTHQTVHLAPHEYDRWEPGEQYGLMQRIARDLLYANDGPDIVTVYEHGGWYLTFSLLPYTREFATVGTANDLWQPEEKIRQFWQTINAGTLHHLPAIRRA